MQFPFHTRLILIGFLTIMVQSCSTYTPPKVDTEQHTRDSIYTEHTPEIEAFFDKLKWIDTSGYNGRPEVLPDTISETALIMKILQGHTKEDIEFDSTIKVTASNSVLVNNLTGGFLKFTPKDSVLRTMRAKYLLTQFDSRSSVSPEGANNDRIPWFWHFYNSRGKKSSVEDSISMGEKEFLIKETNKKLEDLNNIKYAIIVNDLFMINPKMISKESFQTGEIVGVIELYELATGNFLARDLYHIENSEEVASFAFGASDIAKNAWNIQLRQDLSKQKNKYIVEYFNITGSIN